MLFGKRTAQRAGHTDTIADFRPVTPHRRVVSGRLAEQGDIDRKPPFGVPPFGDIATDQFTIILIACFDQPGVQFLEVVFAKTLLPSSVRTEASRRATVVLPRVPVTAMRSGTAFRCRSRRMRSTTRYASQVAERTDKTRSGVMIMEDTPRSEPGQSGFSSFSPGALGPLGTK